MFAKPVDEITPACAARGEVEHKVLLFIYGGVNIGAVEQENVAIAA